MTIRILDTATETNFIAATTQYDAIQALIAEWAGADITIKLYQNSTLLSTLVCEPWVHDRVPTVDTLTPGNLVSRTWAANGSPSKLVFSASTTDIFEATLGVGSGEIQINSATKELCTEVFNSFTFTADAALPKGGPIYPTWRTAISAGKWAIISTANILSDLDPRYNAAINPVYSSTPEWGGTGFGQQRLFAPWCGGCADTDNSVWWAPLSGGHTDYGGNEPYKIDLSADTPEWVMVRPPSGAIGNLLTTKDGLESTGIYADGQPRAVHSYNKPCYVPGDAPWLGVMGAAWFAGNAGLIAPVRIDPITGLGTIGATITTTPPAIERTSAGGSCYDSTRNAIWFRVSGTGYIFKYDITGDSWSREGGSLAGGSYVGMCYVEEQDLIVLFDGSTLRLYDPVAATYTAPTVSGSTTGASITGQAQPQWTGTDIAWWDNSTNTTIISKLTPPAGDWKVGTWTLDSYAVAGSNIVTPTVRNTNGTFGRFAYFPTLAGFFLINEANQDAYFFALE